MLTLRMFSKAEGEKAVKREYDRLASDYETRWAFYINRSVQETVKWVKLKPRDKILDIGCGTGALLQHIATAFPTVDLNGIDFSREMLQIAKNNLGPRATLQVANAEKLPFKSHQFDAVLSISSFHYWRNPEKCLTEIIRVLKPSGQLVITDWCHDFIACRVFDFFLQAFNRAHFKTYGKQELKFLLSSMGFKAIRIDSYKINWLWGLMSASACQSSELEFTGNE